MLGLTIAAVLSFATSAAPPVPLCTAAHRPVEGMRVEARGSMLLDQHGIWFVDARRRCSITLGAAPDTTAATKLIWLSVHNGAWTRTDATVAGRLEWRDEPPARGLPNGYWILMADEVKDDIIFFLTEKETRADWERWPKAFGKDGDGKPVRRSRG